MPPHSLWAAALPIAGSTLEFLPMAGNFHEWSSPQHRRNSHHTPHCYSWELKPIKYLQPKVIKTLIKNYKCDTLVYTQTWLVLAMLFSNRQNKVVFHLTWETFAYLHGLCIVVAQVCRYWHSQDFTFTAANVIIMEQMIKYILLLSMQIQSGKTREILSCAVISSMLGNVTWTEGEHGRWSICNATSIWLIQKTDDWSTQILSYSG